MKRSRIVIAAGILVALVLAGVVSFYASGSPDGLERVSEDQGFSKHAKDPINKDSPLADYGVKGVDNERASVGLSGVIGVVVVLALGSGVAFAVRKKSVRAPKPVQES